MQAYIAVELNRQVRQMDIAFDESTGLVTADILPNYRLVLNAQAAARLCSFFEHLAGMLYFSPANDPDPAAPVERFCPECGEAFAVADVTAYLEHMADDHEWDEYDAIDLIEEGTD